MNKSEAELLLHPVVRQVAPWITSKKHFTYADLQRLWALKTIEAARMRIYRLGIKTILISGNQAVVTAVDLAQAIINRHYRFI